MPYRHLTQAETDTLLERRCTADNWDNVLVAEGFSAERVRDARFSGRIRLGAFRGELTLEGGVKQPSGIYDASLHNCEVGDEAYIARVRRRIANYRIGPGARVEDIGLLVTEGRTAFGNGTEVRALNEAGGREVLLYDRLSAQTAALMCLYRHRPDVTKRLRSMILAYAENASDRIGSVGAGAVIVSCGAIRDTRIGEGARIEGALLLRNGSVNSDSAAPAFVGEGVTARNFIIASGARVGEGSRLENCFVGQGAETGKGFSLYDSLLFANCQMFHGEACSIFGGPYTVTHHKSTLLIAGLFSFMNAGSATNQSNHLYKLGPTQQGVMARGCKTASGAYLLWPARVGAFTLVSGKHYGHPDTDHMPFSYLLEKNGRSLLLPGVNLGRAGTLRDAEKWPARDLRQTHDRLDLIHFDTLSPYTACRMLQGYAELSGLSVQAANEYPYRGAVIPAESLNKGMKYYRAGLYYYIGEQLAKRMESEPISSREELRRLLEPASPAGEGHWSDLAGLYAPDTEINRLLDDLGSGCVSDIAELETRFSDLFAHYSEYAWAWARQAWTELSGQRMEDLSTLPDLIEAWEESALFLYDLMQEDAAKEYASVSLTGYGADDVPATETEDFRQTRGTIEEHPFTRRLRQRRENTLKRTGSLRRIFSQLS